MKITTVKLADSTKKRLLDTDLAEKGKSFDMIINDLITSYQRNTKQYKKDYDNWKKGRKRYEEEHDKWKKKTKKYDDKYNKEKEMWERLLKWAQSQGFKG